MKNYNVHLHELRKAQNLSLKEASKAIGINRLMLYLYENGYFRPTKKAKEKLEVFYKEKISYEGEDAYPAPTKEKTISSEKKALGVKRIVFGSLSALFLICTILGGVLFNKSVNNVESYYGETYNQIREKVNTEGKLGHDLVTSLEYRYIDEEIGSGVGTFIFYETDNLLYFNECTYSTTYLTEDLGFARFHYHFGSNLGVSSYVGEFNFGSWSKGIYLSCNFTYEGEAITKIESLNISMNNGYDITEDQVVGLVNDCLPHVETAFSTLLTKQLGHDTSFYHDFLSAREQGRKINFALQITGLILILPSIIAFFIVFGVFIGSLIQNIKPRLVTTEPKARSKELEPLPKDWKVEFGIPDIFLVIFSKVLQVGSILLLLLAFLGKVGLPLPKFMSEADFLSFLRISLLAGIFLEHFVMIGRIKKATTLFKTIIYNLFIFLFVATIETVLIVLTDAWGYDFASLIFNYVPSNVYQVVAIHYLIFLFLFFEPSFLNEKKKYVRYIWHSLSFIPLGLLIASYFLSNNYALTYGVQANIFMNFWFPNGFLPLSIVCVLFMYLTFGIRLYFERRYGKNNAHIFFYGDRYTIYENAICSILILIVASLDFLFIHNQYGYYLGLGSNAWIYTLIPFIILCKYSPNNQQVLLLKEEPRKGRL